MLGSKTLIRPSTSMVDAVYRVVDAGCIVAALSLASWVTGGMRAELFWLLAAAGTALFNVVGAFSGVYRNWRGTPVDRVVTCSLISWFFTFTSVLAAGYATALPDHVSRSATATWFFAAAGLLALKPSGDSRHAASAASPGSELPQICRRRRDGDRIPAGREH